MLFSLSQDKQRNLKLYGLYKKEHKEISDIIKRELTLLPLIYDTNIQTVLKKLNALVKQTPLYKNYIEIL